MGAADGLHGSAPARGKAMIDYATIKSVHVGAVALSGTLFLARGAWRFAHPDAPMPRLARLVPPLVDTVLLVSALALAALWQRTGLPMGWIGAKVAVLVAYIALGTLALRAGLAAGARAVALAAAALAFGYIVSVALVKSPAGAWRWLS